MTQVNGRPINRIVILTGAGVSAESGLATFRDSDGLWEKHDPMEIATPEAFERDPALVYRFYNARRNQLQDVEPNEAHRSFARLQSQFSGDVFLVTQNVDDLHERGGSEQVCHMHGQLNSMLCVACSQAQPVPGDYDGTTYCPACGVAGKLRPDIVWFGEIPYQMDTIVSMLRNCDLFIAAGTSGVVYPAAGFVQEALAAGAQTIEINREVSEVTGYFHQQRCGVASREVTALVEELLAD
ncbi:NAD-dependent protein deacylase [Halioglobus japonicus]|nr:NAD-dependent protein deacylase [Halioglobus japonicus]